MLLRLISLLLFLIPLTVIASPQLNFGSSRSQTANSIPISPCPGIFKYEHFDGNIIGVAYISSSPRTKSSDEPFTVDIDVHIDEFLPEARRDIMQLQLFEERNDLKTVLKIIRNAETTPIALKLKFPSNVPIPSLTKIKVNERIVCHGRSVQSLMEYSTFSVNYILYPTLHHFPETQHNIGTVNTTPGKTETRKVTEEIKVTSCNCPIVPVTSCPDCQRDVNHCPPPIIKECPPIYSQKQVDCPIQCPPVKECGPLTTVVRESPHAISIHIQRLNQSVHSQSLQGEHNTDFGKRRKRDIQNEDCGYTKVPIGSTGIIQEGDWPWTAAIFEVKKVGHIIFKCGGTIINKNYIITAASCLSSHNDGPIEREKYLITLGQHHMNKVESRVQYRTIKKIALHSDSKKPDIAILQLSSPISYTDCVRPVCLWNMNNKVTKEFNHEIGTIVGWRNSNENANLADQRLKSELKLVPNDKCQINEAVNASWICGVHNGSTPCSADIGSGMFVTYKTRGDEMKMKWFLRGIVNFSEGNNPRHQYIKLTDITRARKWIQSVLT